MPRRDDLQLGLFAAPGPEATPAYAPDLVALGARLASLPLYLGTSSWSFPGWSGLVYPPGLGPGDLAARGLGWYARHPLLRVAGVDRSYYAPLAAADYRAYAAQVPPAFRFVVKAERTITTPPEQLPAGPAAAPGAFLAADRLQRHCIEPLVDGLGAGRAALLLQFPPLDRRYAREPARFLDGLANLLRVIPRGLDCFVELRNAALVTPGYFALLRANSVAHCYSVHPGAASLRAQAAVAGAEEVPGPLLVRWNLRRDRAYESARAEFAPFDRLVAPDPATRDEAVRLATAALAAGRTVFVLANNKAEGSAPLTIIEFARALDAARAPSPPGPAAVGGAS